MSFGFKDLKDFKTYKEKVKKAVVSLDKTNYSVIMFKFNGDFQSKEILLVGSKINDIIEEIGLYRGEKVAPKTIDQGVINQGVVVSKRGKITVEMIKSWGLESELRLGGWEPSDLVPGTSFTGLQALELAAGFEKVCAKCEHKVLKNKLTSRIVDLREQINQGTPSNVPDTLALIRLHASNISRVDELQKKLESFEKVIHSRGVPSSAIALYESAKKNFDEANFQLFEQDCVSLGKELPLVGNRFAKLDPKQNKISVENNNEALKKSGNKIASAYKLVKTNMENSIDLVLSRPNDPEAGEAKALKGLLKSSMKSDLHKLLVGFEKGHSNKDTRLKLAQKIIEVTQEYQDAIDGEPKLSGGGLLGSKYYALLRHIHSQMSDVMMEP